MCKVIRSIPNPSPLPNSHPPSPATRATSNRHFRFQDNARGYRTSDGYGTTRRVAVVVYSSTPYIYMYIHTRAILCPRVSVACEKEDVTRPPPAVPRARTRVRRAVERPARDGGRRERRGWIPGMPVYGRHDNGPRRTISREVRKRRPH